MRGPLPPPGAQALRLATLRLTAVAYESAIRGTVREFWREGERIGGTALGEAFPAALRAMDDHPGEMVPITSLDFFAAAPGDPKEDW